MWRADFGAGEQAGIYKRQGGVRKVAEVIGRELKVVRRESKSGKLLSLGEVRRGKCCEER